MQIRLWVWSSLILYNVFREPFGSLTSALTSCRSAPRSVFSCGPSDGENVFDTWAFGRKGQDCQCQQEIQTKKFMFMLHFFPEFEPFCSHRSSHVAACLRVSKNFHIVKGFLQRETPRALQSDRDNSSPSMFPTLKRTRLFFSGREKGHYDRGLFTRRISRLSKILNFSRTSRKRDSNLGPEKTVDGGQITHLIRVRLGIFLFDFF